MPRETVKSNRMMPLQPNRKKRSRQKKRAFGSFFLPFELFHLKKHASPRSDGFLSAGRIVSYRLNRIFAIG